jgi:hypothetical protein
MTDQEAANLRKISRLGPLAESSNFRSAPGGILQESPYLTKPRVTARVEDLRAGEERER